MLTIFEIIEGVFAAIGFGFCVGIAYVVLLGSEVKELPYETYERQIGAI